MSKALIKENLGSGKYTVEIIKNTDSIQSRITKINAELAKLKVIEEKTAMIELQIVSLEKKKTMLESLTESNVAREVWCADFQDDLAGEVGIVNVPDEPDRYINIRPGNAVYDEKMLGDTHPVMNMEPETTFFNLGIMPGVQRWKPQFRYGKIIESGTSGTFNVFVVSAFSSQQGLSINPEADTTMGTMGTAEAIPSGWEYFQENYPESPIATNTEAGSEVILTPERLSQLESINDSVNVTHAYQTDDGAADTWDIMNDGDSGDCDDFALTKMQKLIDLGWNPADLHITVCSYYDNGEIIGHAVLTVDTDKGTYVLDNRYSGIALVTNGQFSGYTWVQRLNGGVWENVSVGHQTNNVPVEYMECDDAAFAVGDDVLMSFSGSWDTPKIIGFKEEPRTCGRFAINFDSGTVKIYTLSISQRLSLAGYYGEYSFYNDCEVVTGIVTVDIDEEDNLIKKELIWGLTGNPATGANLGFTGRNLDTGAAEKFTDWGPDEEWYPACNALCFGERGLFAAHNWADTSGSSQFVTDEGVPIIDNVTVGVSGITYHDIVDSGVGEWFYYNADDIIKIEGLAYQDGYLYAIGYDAAGTESQYPPSCIYKWQIGTDHTQYTFRGLSRFTAEIVNMPDPDYDVARNIKIFNNEIYVRCGQAGDCQTDPNYIWGITGTDYDAYFLCDNRVDVYDLDLNLVRSFTYDAGYTVDARRGMYVDGNRVFLNVDYSNGQSTIKVYDCLTGELLQTKSLSGYIFGMG